MASSYARSKGRSNSDGGFFGVPKKVLQHDNFINLTPYANKLLFDLGEQYKGKNNGDLCATWSFMQKRGWRSKQTLNNSLNELKHYGIIVTTQYGGLNQPTLYALAWNKIDKSEKGTDFKVGDNPGTWKQTKKKYLSQSTIKKRNQKKS